jgi:endoglucanase
MPGLFTAKIAHVTILLLALQAAYLAAYIAQGEAPIEIRNVFRQRSRWTKGHYQVFYSRHNPLINFDLPLFHRFLYSYATWSPFCTVILVPGEEGVWD